MAESGEPIRERPSNRAGEAGHLPREEARRPTPSLSIRRSTTSAAMFRFVGCCSSRLSASLSGP